MHPVVRIHAMTLRTPEMLQAFSLELQSRGTAFPIVRDKMRYAEML